jgi:hypothetical protein
MTYLKQSGDQAFDQARARLTELEDRKDALGSEIGAFIAAADAEEEIAECEAEVAELEILLEQSRKEADMEKTMQNLDTINKAVDASGADFQKVRQQAEDLYDQAVATIMKRDRCDASTAHARAATDPVAKAAYDTALELEERERSARDGAGRIAAYLG